MTFGAIMNLRKLNVTLIEQAFLKEAVKQYKPKICPCRFCRNCIPEVGITAF